MLGHIRSDLLETDQSLDSMWIMQIVLFVEEEFAVKLPDGAVTRATFCAARHIAEAIRRTRADGHAWDSVGAVERRGPVPRHRRE